MKSRQYSQRNSTQQKETSTPLSTPSERLLKSRPFTIQKQTAEKSQAPELKASLKQTDKYGHHPIQHAPRRANSLPANYERTSSSTNLNQSKPIDTKDNLKQLVNYDDDPNKNAFIKYDNLMQQVPSNVPNTWSPAVHSRQKQGLDNQIQHGINFNWNTPDGKGVHIHGHGPDPLAPQNSDSEKGHIGRIQIKDPNLPKKSDGVNDNGWLHSKTLKETKVQHPKKQGKTFMKDVEEPPATWGKGNKGKAAELSHIPLSNHPTNPINYPIIKGKLGDYPQIGAKPGTYPQIGAKPGKGNPVDLTQLPEVNPLIKRISPINRRYSIA